MQIFQVLKSLVSMRPDIAYFFNVKIVTSLAFIFTMDKTLVKIIFGCKCFICQPIFKSFVALL